MLKSEYLYRHVERCIHGRMPSCAGNCPLHLDIRAFAEKIGQQRWNAAYRIYREAVCFPEIVSRLCAARCKEACIRNKSDSAIEMRLLEVAVVRYATKKDPDDYYMPRKTERIAVVGDGASGLSCALKLSKRKYAVTVFAESGQFGALISDDIAEDVQTEELERQFQYSEVAFEVLSPQELPLSSSWDAVFFTNSPKQYRHLDVDCFFYNQEKCVDPIAQIASGIAAARQIESYFLTGRRIGPSLEEAVVFDMGLFERKVFLSPVHGNSGFDERGAMMEAARCLRCNCEKCREACDMLQQFDRIPPKLPDGLYATLYPIPEITSRPDTRLIASCSMCSLCREVCPVGIDTGELVSAVKCEMQAIFDLPPVFSDFWLRDFEEVCDNMYAVDAESDYLLFPGCQFPASNSASIEKVLYSLSKKIGRVSTMYACCGASARWIGDEIRAEKHREKIETMIHNLDAKKVVMVCPMCQKEFKTYYRDIDVMSIYDFFDEGKLEESADQRDDLPEVVLFDPCATRDMPELQHQVRMLLRGLGYQVKELPYHGRFAKCCGFGGHIYPANPQLADHIVLNHINHYDLPIVSYCSNCKDLFRSAGRETALLLDLLIGCDTPFGTEHLSLGERMRNRKAFLAKIRTDGGGDSSKKKVEDERKIIMKEEVVQKFNRMLVQDEEGFEVVRKSEKNNRKILLPNGNFLGQERIGAITLWVEYVSSKEHLTIVDAYSHRVEINVPI